ncbi:MAG: hypothetical protein ACREA0_24010 [bacterium]
MRALPVQVQTGLPFFSRSKRPVDPESSIYMLFRTNREVLAFNRGYAFLGTVPSATTALWGKLKRHPGAVEFEKGRTWRGRRGDALWFDLADRRR